MYLTYFWKQVGKIDNQSSSLVTTFSLVSVVLL